MALTAKVSTIARNAVGKAQEFSGDRNIPGGFSPGGPKALQVFVAEYDFDKDGALAVGRNGSGVYIPANFVVLNAELEVLVVPVGPTNMGVDLENDDDIVAAAAIAGAPWSSANTRVVGVPDFATAGDSKKTTAVREILFNVTGAVTSAGRFNVIIMGYQSTANS